MNNKTLPLSTFSEIPVPNFNAKQITALVKDGGSTVGYQLSNGEVISKSTAVKMARNGEIKGVGIAKRYSREYLKSLPDDSEGNNLSNLPSITSNGPML